MLLAHAAAPTWTLFLAGALAGLAAVQLGSMVRARWSHLLDDPAKLHTAFSFESVADEVIFVTGPAFTALVATSLNVYAGLVVAVVLAVSGTTAFALLRSGQPPVVRHREHRGSPIAIPGVAVLSVVLLGMGAVFGTVDIVTVAFAQEHGNKAVAGLLLASFSAGSMVSGLWYGSRAWKLTLRSRFVRGLGVFAVGLTPIVLDRRAGPDGGRAVLRRPGHLAHADHQLLADRTAGPGPCSSTRACRGCRRRSGSAWRSAPGRAATWPRRSAPPTRTVSPTAAPCWRPSSGSSGRARCGRRWFLSIVHIHDVHELGGQPVDHPG